jgi:hypothetical protein
MLRFQRCEILEAPALVNQQVKLIGLHKSETLDLEDNSSVAGYFGVGDQFLQI